MTATAKRIARFVVVYPCDLIPDVNMYDAGK